METCQIRSQEDFGHFIEQKHRETLALAQSNTQEFVEKENALMDFEILLSINMDEKDRKKLTEQSRKLRTDSWRELKEQSKEDFNKLNCVLDNL